MNKTPTEKRCIKCSEVKPLTSFSVHSRCKDGLSSECRVCKGAYNRAQYAEKREAIRERHQACLCEDVEKIAPHDERVARLIPLLRWMRYDDVLVCGDWRLELLYLERGFPHFRLYFQSRVLGVADVFSDSPDLSNSRQLPVVQHTLATHLVACGWRAEAVQKREGEAITLSARM